MKGSMDVPSIPCLGESWIPINHNEQDWDSQKNTREGLHNSNAIHFFACMKQTTFQYWFWLWHTLIGL